MRCNTESINGTGDTHKHAGFGIKNRLHWSRPGYKMSELIVLHSVESSGRELLKPSSNWFADSLMEALKPCRIGLCNADYADYSITVLGVSDTKCWQMLGLDRHHLVFDFCIESL